MVYLYKDGKIIKTYPDFLHYLRDDNDILQQEGIFLYETGDEHIFTFKQKGKGFSGRLTRAPLETVPVEFKTMLLLLGE